LVHKVPHLLTSPATKAVALPSSLFCNRSMCTLPHRCSLCEPEGTSKSYFGDELRKHMATMHGEFFQRSLHKFSTSHCRLCGDMVECDEEEHKSSCPVGRVRWWKALTGCKAAEELGGTKLEEIGELFQEQGTEAKLNVVGNQGQECAASCSDEVEERQSKSKEGKSEAMQGQGISCNMASSGIKTLKVKKIVRVATTSRTPLKSDDQKMNQERSRSLEEGETVNSCVRNNYRRGFKHSSKIVVSSYEARVIVGRDGANVKKLEVMSGALIDVKSRCKRSSQRTVEISGEEVAVEKAEELVNGFLLKNCTTTLELSRQEALALFEHKGKLLNQRKTKGVGMYIDFEEACGKSRKVYILGLEEEVKKVKERIEDYLESVLLLLISPTERAILLCGGKNNLLCDISNKQVDAHCTIKDHNLVIFGSLEGKKKAAAAVKEQLRLRMESALVLPLSHAEKNVLLCGGKNGLLSDISNTLGVHCNIEDLNLMIYGSFEERKKAATAVKEQLRLKMTVV